jgi:hypothetical protein
MRISNRGKVLLVGAFILTGAAGWAQQTQKPVKADNISTDLAVTYAGERFQALPGPTSLWFKGGGADAAVTFKSVLGMSGLGIAASLTGDQAVNITPGVDAKKFTYLAGPRYTWKAWQSHASDADNRRLQVFGQALFGVTHGYDGIYPATSGATSSANSFAMQTGGGFNYYLTRNFGLRLLEADYVRTALPNGAANIQNELRLSAGVIWHIHRR